MHGIEFLTNCQNDASLTITLIFTQTRPLRLSPPQADDGGRGTPRHKAFFMFMLSLAFFAVHARRSEQEEAGGFV